MTVLVGRYGDRIGRRRCYVGLYVALAAVGIVRWPPPASWPS